MRSPIALQRAVSLLFVLAAVCGSIGLLGYAAISNPKIAQLAAEITGVKASTLIPPATAHSLLCLAAHMHSTSLAHVYRAIAVTALDSAAAAQQIHTPCGGDGRSALEIALQSHTPDVAVELLAVSHVTRAHGTENIDQETRVDRFETRGETHTHTHHLSADPVRTPMLDLETWLHSEAKKHPRTHTHTTTQTLLRAHRNTHTHPHSGIAQLEYARALLLLHNNATGHVSYGGGRHMAMQVAGVYRKAIELEPRLVAAYVELAQLIMRHPHVAHTHTHNNTQGVADTNTQGLKVLKLPSYRESENLLLEALALLPSSWDIYRHIGLNYVLQREFNAAEEFLEYAVWLGGKQSALTHYAYGWYMAIHKKDEPVAQKHLDLAMWMDPDLKPKCILALGVMQRKKLLLKTSVQNFRRAMQLDPYMHEAPYQLALALDGMLYDKANVTERLTEVDALYKQSLEMAPYAPDIYNEYALFVKNTKHDSATAEQLYKKALEIDASHLAVLNNLAHLLYLKGDFQGAENMWRRVADLDTNAAQARNNLANVIKQIRGDLVEAERLYAEAIKINPAIPQYHNNMGRLLEIKPEPDLIGAEKAYRKALELDPDFALARTNLANLLKKKGTQEGDAQAQREAMQHLERAEQAQIDSNPYGDKAAEQRLKRYALWKQVEKGTVFDCLSSELLEREAGSVVMCVLLRGTYALLGR